MKDLDVGSDVSYTVVRKGPKISAEEVKKLPAGTIPPKVCREDLRPHRLLLMEPGLPCIF